MSSRPFAAAPRTDCYFPSAIVENARKSLSRCIDRGEGPGLIVGPAGTGKTLLCQMLAEEFAGRFAVALLSSGRLATRQALLQAILYELRRPYRGMDEGELRLLLLDYLEPVAGGNDGLLLLIDEAHTLPLRLLEEVRMISNLVRAGQPRVRVVLSGNSTLEERFASPKLQSFSQRLAVRCYLESLDCAETADYVRAQISSAGGNASQLFRDDAMSSIYRATDGIPRLINQVCDHALILASLGGLEQINSEAIEEAWADLQQLPGPWTSAPKVGAPASAVVEFGGLDESSDEMPEAIPFPAAPKLAMPTPEEQLAIIEEHLARIDEDFEPAGSIGTEVELDFPEFGDPFAEDFAEEEVILERYHSDAEMFAGLQRVSPREGLSLSSLLGTLDGSPITNISVPPAVFADRPAVVSHPTEMLPQLVLSSPGSSAADGASFADSAESEIVIEDDALECVAAARPSKLEYGQLFAKLRRG